MKINENICQAVATTYDPRTANGQEAHEEQGNLSRGRANELAQQWEVIGYWGSVYNQFTGECVDEYSPICCHDKLFTHLP